LQHEYLVLHKPKFKIRDGRRVSGFRYLLALENGEPADPPGFVTAVPDWRPGMTLVASSGQLFKILAVEVETEADESHERWSSSRRAGWHRAQALEEYGSGRPTRLETEPF
jgi:hypothetical protein